MKGGDEIGGIRLQEEVKRHGEIEVWRGVRLADDAELAVKIAPLDTAAARLVVHEAAAYRSVVSRHTVSCAEFGEEGGRVYLALQWYSGGSLKERLKKGKLSEHELTALARQLLLALHDLHKAGMMHRDVKPSNVFFDEIGEVRLGDFGIALLPDEKPKRGAVVGTAGYRSPEQAAGTKLDERSDLYALGLLLKECVGEATASFMRFLDDLTAEAPVFRPRNALKALERLR